MQRTRLTGIGISLLLIILLSGAARAASSANYAINWQVLSGGGAPASAGTVTLNGSLGQTAIGLAARNTIGLRSGYWYGINSQAITSSKTYLPLIFKQPQVVIGSPN